jgi:DNA recombination protein RmuC
MAWIFIAIMTAVIILGAGAFFLFARFKRENDQSAARDGLSEIIESSRRFMEVTHEQMNAMRQELNERLKENRQSLETSTRHMQTQVVGVSAKLAELQERSNQILEVGKDIATLQEILRAPKLRGSLGELFLGDLLAQILPQEHYALQYRFKSGEIVDAVMKLREGRLIPIDAKFTGMAFGRLMETQDEAEKKRLRRQFMQDTRARIDEIATKYILPAEGTLDFALMYVPAENIYYEAMVNFADDGLLSYAFSKRVIPVSPNTFYVYLQTILLGLRGMQIEKSAADILKHLGQLKGEFDRFSDRFRILGKHLTEARGSYEDSVVRFERMTERLERVGEEVPALDSDTEEKQSEKETKLSI